MARWRFDLKHPVEKLVTIGFGVVLATTLVIGCCSLLTIDRLGAAEISNGKVLRGAMAMQVVIFGATAVNLAAAVVSLFWIRKQLRASHKFYLDLEKTQADLKDSHRELESFAYTISHDLRAPLRVMRGFAQVLQEDHAPALAEDAHACVQRISDAASRMDLLIHDLLQYSRLTREKVELATVDLDKVFTDVASELDHAIRETGGLVSKPVPLGQATGHPRMVRQILENLVANALKFVPVGAKPAVLVRTVQHDDRVRVEVRDKGIGVEPEYQDKIFKVFERLHGVETYPGTGIGLAIVRKAAERMGGTCGVESKLGEGSIFWFDLPRVPKTARHMHEGRKGDRVAEV